MQHGHEEGEVEALWGQSRGQEWRDAAVPLSPPSGARGQPDASPLPLVAGATLGSPLSSGGRDQPRISSLL